MLGLFLAPMSCALFSTKSLVSVGYSAQKNPQLCPDTLEGWFSCSNRAGFPENLCDFAELLEVSMLPRKSGVILSEGTTGKGQKQWDCGFSVLSP